MPTLYVLYYKFTYCAPPPPLNHSYTSAWGWFSLSHCTCRKWELNHQKECFQNLSVRYTILYRHFDHKRVSLKVLTPKYFRSDHKSMRGPKFSENNDQFFGKFGPPGQNFRRTKISLTVLSPLVYDVIAVRWCDSMDMARRDAQRSDVSLKISFRDGRLFRDRISPCTAVPHGVV